MSKTNETPGMRRGRFSVQLLRPKWIGFSECVVFDVGMRTPQADHNERAPALFASLPERTF